MSNLCNNLTSDPDSSETIFCDLKTASDYQRKIYRNRYWYAVDQIVKLYTNTCQCPCLRILDAATGMGAGAAYISEQLGARGIGAEVVGVDLEPAAIAQAKESYFGYALYDEQDIIEAVASNDWDVIVSMETMEHVTPEIVRRFLEKASLKLNKPGLFICSSPRRRPRESKVKRPGHINEMYYDEFKYLLGEFFPRLEFASMDRYGNLIADTADSNLMLATGYIPNKTEVFV